jgi:hypothetical protein
VVLDPEERLSPGRSAPAAAAIGCQPSASRCWWPTSRRYAVVDRFGGEVGLWFDPVTPDAG